MPIIDIATMRGEVPRTADHLLPDSAAVIARDCHFDRGIVAALRGDRQEAKTFPVAPQTIFKYTDQFWFAWRGDVNAIRSPIAQDNYGRVYYTDGEYPKVTSNAIATGGENMPTAHYRLGIPAPEHAIVISAITPPDDAEEDDATDDETRYYTETYVTEYGEEGPPGPASAEITIVHPGSAVTLTLQPPGTSRSNITHRRVYRSATSTESADYLLVAELPIAQGAFVDGLTDSELSATLETYDYYMPPDNMIGLCLMSNGIAAGFAGNEVMFSRAYLPYAWPTSYRLTTEHDVVAIAALGTSLVAGTKGKPVIFSGVNPENITESTLDVEQACVSARSMVAVNGNVLYASPDGLVSVGANAALVVTESIITREQWQVFKPETIRAWRVEGKYLACYEGGVFVFDPQSGDFRHLSTRFDTAFNDMLTDTLFLVKGKQLYSFQTSEQFLPMTWRSKEFRTPPATAFNCMRVKSPRLSAIGIRIWVYIGDNAREFHLPPGAIPSTAFRLPSNMIGEHWQVEVYGAGQVDRITLATSMEELSQ